MTTKGWETHLPPSFPIERLAREAVREGEQRRRRRRRRYQGALTGAGALALLGGTAALLTTGDDAPEQVSAGPGPAQVVTVPATGDVPGSFDVGPIQARSNGKIAFIRSTGPGDPAPKLYLMNEDGSGQTVMAETTQGGHLTWSPDGTKLAFRDVGGIYVVNADGTGETRLPGTSSADAWPAWSPNGAQIAVRSLEGGSDGIYVLDVDGSGRRRVVEGGAWPAWSPDGRRIAYSDGEHIYVVNADGGGRRRITSMPGAKDSPTWSHDGRKIAFRLNDAIAVTDVDGGQSRNLATPGGTGLANPEGRGAIKLASGRGTPAEVRWSPDGTKLVYTIYQTGQACSIWIMNADGSDQKPLTDNSTCDRDPAWQPRP